MAAQYADALAAAVPAAVALMQSKTGSDVMESIRYVSCEQGGCTDVTIDLPSRITPTLTIAAYWHGAVPLVCQAQRQAWRAC